MCFTGALEVVLQVDGKEHPVPVEEATVASLAQPTGKKEQMDLNSNI